ncbi:LETM1-related biofilm-associated protein [Aestuariibaculum sp. YM273]|uniref:LETM1-related biofilm-associated protein n=1 Tax=Aestuariibaculum sp. YM273 TaxID=3070659 RepID=UPI0027DB1DA2|nr:LETM1-related biofilm-associated protein [Aestuariibaculum sp. YM273]WMI64478.1 LETM1-related biofilm-associated protein [Aestuariibaculum sp. YM273]
MNPSANGWIKKLLREVEAKPEFLNLSDKTFYTALRDCGFIYGSNLDVALNILPKEDLIEEELCKINHCLALLHTYHNATTETPFVESVIDFYTEISERKTSFFEDLLGGKKSDEQLEKLIHKRIQIDANIITKNFNYFIINALLYIDVLAYDNYLREQTISTSYIKNLEASIECVSLDVLNTKEDKNAYDESLIRLIESSLRFQDHTHITYEDAISNIKTPLEKQYILDLACMAAWTDKTIDSTEKRFLIQLGRDFKIETQLIKQSLETVNSFYTTNKENIAVLGSKNIVQSFYNNSSKMVKKLITRNRKRLYKELKDSKELMVLLTQSTVRDLTSEEQKKIQDQLLDIFKSIPSLAIFLLPGGAILLPLVVKFIPKLLPSAFDENRIDED